MFSITKLVRVSTIAILVLCASVVSGSPAATAGQLASSGAGNGPKITIQSGISGYMIAVC